MRPLITIVLIAAALFAWEGHSFDTTRATTINDGFVFRVAHGDTEMTCPVVQVLLNGAPFNIRNCVIEGDGEFQLVFDSTNIPAGGYEGVSVSFQSEVNCIGVPPSTICPERGLALTQQACIAEAVWPDADSGNCEHHYLVPGSPSPLYPPGTVYEADVDAYTGTAYPMPISTFVGRVVAFDVNCYEPGVVTLSWSASYIRSYPDSVFGTIGEGGSGLIDIDCQPAGSASPTPAPNQPTPTPTPMPTTVRGDVNCDGETNAVDAALLLQHSAGLLPSLSCAQNADINGDGRADAIDAAITLQYVAGLLLHLPV